MTDIVEVASGELEIVEVSSGSIEIIEIAVQGPPGVDADHSGLLNLDADDHEQYHTDARGDARYALLAHNHSGTYEPADADLQAHLVSTSNPHSVTAAQVGADAGGTAAGLIASHEGAANPHPGYLTPAEGDAAYSALGHNHSGVYDPAGTATSAVSSHAGGTDVHAIASVTGLQGALDGKSTTSHDHAATYAPIAQGVTNGDSHDHSGGDGAQIAYSGLSGLPTLGTAAATDSTAYATAAQGSTADSAVQPGDDAADLGSGAATDGYVLTADGAGGAAWEAAAVTYAGAASETHAATEKTTPVDADELPLVDSAASWVLKKLTWANLKTTLTSIFVLLAGKSGGQTLIGGTGVTDKLVLQGTSGNGTSTSTALEVKVGNNGVLSALNVLNNGQLIIQGDATTDGPVYGSELLTSAGWTVTAGWTESPDDVFAHSSGTDTLTHSATITSGYKYQISWTVTGRTAGSVTIAVGGQSAGATATGAFGPTATSTAALTITPTTDFNGTISLVSLKRITAASTPDQVMKNSAGTITCESRFVGGNVSIGTDAGAYLTTGVNNNCLGYRAGYSLTTGSYNNCLGYNAGYSLTTGSYNNCLGYNAGYSLTTGSNNNCLGYNAGRSLTTGVNNNCLGNHAGYSLTTGSYNNCLGYNAGYSLTTGSNNNCLGYNAGYSLTTGSSNNCLGNQAGRYQADGATALTDPENSVYIGYNARGKDNSDNNSVVIGGNTPIGLGANTTVIGTSATTLTRLYGDIATGVDSPSAALHAVKTTEQLRLGYDASYYAAFTVSSAGNLTIDAVNGTIYTPDTIENTVNGGGIVLRSPDGTRYLITVANGGILSIAAA